ncbi:MAG TPA: CRISPR system precrRNA processing endoribonuclease RAMP protein Cas6 [Bryobacteraceae bacterium]|nr:CRISPR system precrRNA processing endoribonuclease RAMP protein Cas6 [Bryobacteraceae bacterium]
MTFELDARTFQLVARRVTRFPPAAAGNVLRGVLGKGLRTVASGEEYARIFAPRATGPGPSGLSDRPRPFVLRCTSLNGRVVQPGEAFCFGLHWFDARSPSLDLIKTAFGRWADVTALDRQRVSLDLAPSRAASRVRVDFQTPTELKAKGQSVNSGFSVLLARARDRVSTLSSLYGDGPLEIDFRALAERAKLIQTARSDLRPLSVERLSKGTGQRHNIGGFVGFAEYEGDLAEFVPYLEAASFTGVGRHCTWGNGHITTKIIA